MLEDKNVIFIVANKEEILSMRTSDDISNLFFRYETASDISTYSAFLALYKLLFLSDTIILLQEAESNLENSEKVFLLNAEFITKLAAFNDEETNALAKNWQDSYWEHGSLGIWSQLYSLRFACKSAIENDKNIYVLNG